MSKESNEIMQLEILVNILKELKRKIVVGNDEVD